LTDLFIEYTCMRWTEVELRS